MWQCDELLVMTVRCNYLEGVIRGMAMATKGWQRDHTSQCSATVRLVYITREHSGQVQVTGFRF